ncbi:Helicase domain protein [Cupriavidus taiwanensis]|uniref:helicase-related protein n=1 Tax=Cupriavidus taiwanensis TaxID=164546 RepID=UPI000E19338A|nr:helicase-related protein [Cupriavidus taiwanensis]SPA28029.1 Helicase domain protein [Cupriavidus taiwanensis]
MKFFTNQGKDTLLEKFKGIFSHNPDIEQFDGLIGYLRASGWFAIQPYLANVSKVRLLVGINVDSILAEHNRKGLLFAGDDGKVRAEVGKALREDIQGAAYEREIEAGVLKFIADVASGRVEIRAHPKRRLHAKVYVFLPKGFCEHKPGAVITGSSNLTAAGLGVEDADMNYEFNVLLHQYEDVKFAGDEFERLWAESVKILPEQIEEVKGETFIGAQVTPRALYFKLLCEYFGSAIEYDPNAVSDLPAGYKRLSYQADAVSAGYRLLEKHSGFFLADVVGLGKTVIATLVAKKFFFKNGFPEHRSNTLIVVPPTVEESWRETTERFKLDNCKIITLGKIGSVRHPERYDLVIVDEAHRFRNDSTGQFEELQRLCKTPSERLDEDGTRMAKKVILVSATPLNNRPADLRNLISLFQDLRRSTLAILNLQAYFASKEKAYADASALPMDDARDAVKAIYTDIRTKVLSEIIIRRTRSDLLAHEEYRNDLEAQGVRFPRVEKPEPVLYKLSPMLESLYDRSMAALAGTGPLALRYARYRALEFLKPDVRQAVPMAEMAAAQLAKIMRIGLAKRLDSSFTAFRYSLHRFRDATRVMSDNFAKGVVYVSSEVNVTKLILEGEEEKLVEMLAEGDENKIKAFRSDQFQDTFLVDLKADLVALENLCSAWDMVKEDPKFDELLVNMRGRFFDPAVNVEGKLVVFSEARDTTDYLRDRLKAAGYSRVLCVDSSNRKELGDTIKANFDANAKHKANEFDVVLTTQVLAEGVNLHRANVIVNYDTPWNSTLLMQRIGRVNRIGTVADRVRIFNFYPSAQVDNDFDLRKRAIMKLQAFHSALGEDSQIYSDEEEVETFGLFDRDPEQEERDERLSLLLELRRFRDDEPDAYRRTKSLPMRSRVGRKSTTMAGGTVVFVKTRGRDGFYKVKADRMVDEITIVEAAGIFRAPADEQAIDLPADHHEQVKAALTRFVVDAVANEPAAAGPAGKLGPRDAKAMSLLKACARYPGASAEDKDKIHLAEAAIQAGTYQALPRRLGQLAARASKEKLSPAHILDGVLDILRDFHLGHVGRKSEQPTIDGILPEIILSESFEA